jgi:TPP-dependent pyruvate/acetoin dehydrogenase alpha subunit
MYGKQTRPIVPKESPHHLGFPEFGILVGTGVIGSDIAKATGAALAAKLRGTTQVVVDFFGDGASNRGDFHESLNLAGIWKLPIVYICENNQFAMATPVSASTGCEDIAERAKGYGFPGVIVRRNDVLEVFEAVQNAVKRAREGRGSTLIECKTYRWSVHAGLSNRETRDTEEIERWRHILGDPIARLQHQLIDKGVLTESAVKEIEANLKAEIDEAVEFAEKMSWPAPEEALKHVYG